MYFDPSQAAQLSCARFCTMDTRHTSWCHRLVSWMRSHGGGLPARNSGDPEEASLANWISKTRIRCIRPLGPFTRPIAPSQLQLSVAEVLIFEEAIGEVIVSRGSLNRVCDSEATSVTPDNVHICKCTVSISLPKGFVFTKGFQLESNSTNADTDEHLGCSTPHTIVKKIDLGESSLSVGVGCYQSVSSTERLAKRFRVTGKSLP